jgi:hypothetical protein
VLFGSCATAPPPLTSASPASAEAPEGARTPRQASLQADDASRKTAALLSTAQKEQQHWDASGPVSGNPEEEPKDKAKPETINEQH